MLGLNGRRAVVTGGASGIGLAIARRLRDEGVKVLACDLKPVPLDGVQALVLDLTHETAADDVLAAVSAQPGGLDILVNNAGMSAFQSIEAHPDALWQQMWALNVDALFRLSRALVPLLKGSPAGRIITIGSVMSEFASPGMAAYATTKHAVLGLTRALACDLGPYGITVNAIQPGAILTGITAPAFEAMPEFRSFWQTKAALGRIGTPEDIAGFAAFLCSDDAAFMTGHGHYVDGGAMQSP